MGWKLTLPGRLTQVLIGSAAVVSIGAVAAVVVDQVVFDDNRAETGELARLELEIAELPWPQNCGDPTLTWVSADSIPGFTVEFDTQELLDAANSSATTSPILTVRYCVRTAADVVPYFLDLSLTDIVDTELSDGPGECEAESLLFPGRACEAAGELSDALTARNYYVSASGTDCLVASRRAELAVWRTPLRGRVTTNTGVCQLGLQLFVEPDVLSPDLVRSIQSDRVQFDMVLEASEIP